MKRLLITLCALMTLAGCKPEASNPRFEIRPEQVEFWAERQEALTIQLDPTAAVTLENLMAQVEGKDLDFYVGPDKIATFKVRGPVPGGNLAGCAGGGDDVAGRAFLGRGLNFSLGQVTALNEQVCALGQAVQAGAGDRVAANGNYLVFGFKTISQAREGFP